MSETRRLLLAGLHRGFMLAGRAKGLTGTDEEVVIDSIAHVAADLIQAGQGRDALAILAQAAPKGDDGSAGDPKSPLQRALDRLPGLTNGAGVSREPIERAENRDEPGENATRPTDSLSVSRTEQPFFSPQQTLIPPHLEPAPYHARKPGSAGELVPAARAADQPGRGHPPTPHPGHPPMGIPVDTENFEKNSGDA